MTDAPATSIRWRDHRWVPTCLCGWVGTGSPWSEAAAGGEADRHTREVHGG